MLRLSKLTDYAVVVLVRLSYAAGAVQTSPGIAGAIGIPEPTVAKVLKALAGAGLDLSAEMVAAARTLRRSLQRFHPSFHFEEQLAGRLRPAPGTAAPVPAGRIIAFPGAVAASAPDEPASRIAHRAGLIAWGAAASIVPIVGAALLARRRGRERWRRADGDAH